MNHETEIVFKNMGVCRGFLNWALRDEVPGQPEELVQKFNADAIIRNAAQCGCDSFTFDARSQWSAHYPTKNFYQHDVLQGRDIYQELIDAGEKYDVKIVAYIPTDTAGMLTVENPDWAVRSLTGKPYRFSQSNFYKACVNSPFRKFMQDSLIELLQNYPQTAGLWFDGPGYCYGCYHDQYCYCEHCCESFRNKYGYDIPTEPAWGTRQLVDYIKWRVDSSVGALEAYYQAVKSVNPDLPITGNLTFAGWADASEKLSKWLDQVGVEISFSDGAYMAAFGQACAGDKPLEIYAATEEFSEAAIQHHVHNMLARGATPNLTLSEPAAMTKVFADIKKHHQLCQGSKRVKWCGLVQSEKTRHFHNRNPWGVHEYKYECYGQFAMLEDSQLPVSIILDDDLEKDLSEYSVIVLPDTAVISQTAVDNLRKYVRNGGGLVGNLAASMRDTLGNQLDDFMLADVFGVNYSGGKIVAQADSPTGNEDPLYAEPRCTETKVLEGVQLVTDSNGEISCVINQSGKGFAAYLPFDIGTAYRNGNAESLREFFAETLQRVARTQPLVSVTAPVACKVFVYEKDEHLFIHLLNDPFVFGRYPYLWKSDRKLDEPREPITKIEVKITGEFELLKSEFECPRSEGQILNSETTIQIPKLSEYLILQLKRLND